ncbi:MAG: DUF485 domain-containing protein [Planctomycetota bacterium]
MTTRNARLGLALFGVYAAFYAVFVFTNAFFAEAMDATPIAGLNVAVLSGFALIVLALVLALIYGYVADTDHAGEPREERS